MALAVLDDALSGAINVAVLQDELAIHHRRRALATLETAGRIVPVHLSVTDPALFRPDGPSALVAVLQTDVVFASGLMV